MNATNVVNKAAVEDDPQRRKPDITRAKKYLNWQPRIPLKLGLDKTVEYFRKELAQMSHKNRNIFLPQPIQSVENRNDVG